MSGEIEIAWLPDKDSRLFEDFPFPVQEKGLTVNEPMAHITEDGRVHPLDTHLWATAELAGEFAAAFGFRQWGRLAGLWHDLGCRCHDNRLSQNRDTLPLTMPGEKEVRTSTSPFKGPQDIRRVSVDAIRIATMPNYPSFNPITFNHTSPFRLISNESEK